MWYIPFIASSMRIMPAVLIGSFLFFHTLMTEGEYPMRRATSAHVLKRVWSNYNFLCASLCSFIVFSPPAGCFLNPFYCLIRRRCFASYPLANAGTAITYHSAIFRITDFICGNVCLHFLYCLFFGKQFFSPLFIFLERFKQKNIYLMPLHTYSILNGCLYIYFIPDFNFFQILTQCFFYKINRNQKEGKRALPPSILQCFPQFSLILVIGCVAYSCQFHCCRIV